MKNEEDIKRVFRKRLRELRKAKGVTQAKAAEGIGVVASGYQFYEAGTKSPGLVTLYRIADYFNVPADYLLGRTDVPQILSRRRTVVKLKA